MPTENVATPQPLMKPNSRMIGIECRRDVRHGDQDEHQPPHADDGYAEQGQHRQTAADLVHPGAEGDAQQRAGELRRGHQQADQQRRKLHRLLERVRGRPIQRDRGKADEEAPGAHDEALARVARAHRFA